MTNKAVILAAGECYDTQDIFPKILLKNPITKKSILDIFVENYANNIIFVLGFRSLSILNSHPDINVIINHSWATTKSAHSLALAVECLPREEIIDIFSGDYFIDEDFFNKFKANKSEDLIVASYREPRSPKACNLRVKNNKILSKYLKVEDNNDPESLGIIRTKVSNIKKWISRQSIEYRSLYATDIIRDSYLNSFDLFIEKDNIFEINNTNDFLKYRSLKYEKNQI